MTILHVIDHNKVIETDDYRFGLTDQRGRMVGFRTIISEIKSHHHCETDKFVCGRRLDFSNTEFFSLRTRPTRNGTGFGASQSHFFAVTRTEIEAEVTRRVEVAKKRYEKKYGER